MNIKKILPIISIILGIINAIEGVLTFTGILPVGRKIGEILYAPRECLAVSEECPDSLYLGIFIFSSVIGIILGIIALIFNVRKFAGILGIILSLIGLIIWLFIWFWIIGWTYA